MAKQLKVNTHVKFTRRNGVTATGRIVQHIANGNGAWVAVNTSEDKKLPSITKVRESQLTAI